MRHRTLKNVCSKIYQKQLLNCNYLWSFRKINSHYKSQIIYVELILNSNIYFLHRSELSVIEKYFVIIMAVSFCSTLSKRRTNICHHKSVSISLFVVNGRRSERSKTGQITLTTMIQGFYDTSLRSAINTQIFYPQYHGN